MAAVLFLPYCQGVYAQAEQHTPVSLELYKMNGLWMQSSNAAGILNDRPDGYATLETGYRRIDGDFRRPQQGQRDDMFHISTEGGLMTSKNIYAWGHFTYERGWIEGANYNMSIIDPYRGMPFYAIDLIPSPWVNQNYDMGFRVATDVLGALSLGLDLSYTASSAAKQYDIRTDNSGMKLQLRPGAAYSFGKHAIGANFNYYSYKEEGISDITSGQEFAYYLHKGLGVADFNLATILSRESNYVGNNVGGSLQYGFNGNGINILLTGSYDYRVEDVNRSWTKPYREGTVRDNQWSVGLKGYTKGKYASYFSLDYGRRSMDGIEFVMVDIGQAWGVAFSSVRSKYETTTASLSYDMVAKGDGGEYGWKAGVAANYIKQDDVYLLPESVFNYENVSMEASFKKNFRFGPRSNRIIPELGVLLNRNLSGGYDYNGPRPDSEPVTGLMAGDLAYLTSDYVAGRASLTYSQTIGRDGSTVIFGKVEGSYTKSADNNLGTRTFLKVTAGCYF